MNFNSLSFLIFLPAVLILYFVIPQRFRWIWLLMASYYFYMSWNAIYALLLFASTLVTYLGGLLLDGTALYSGEDGEDVGMRFRVLRDGRTVDTVNFICAIGPGTKDLVFMCPERA